MILRNVLGFNLESVFYCNFGISRFRTDFSDPGPRVPSNSAHSVIKHTIQLISMLEGNSRPEMIVSGERDIHNPAGNCCSNNTLLFNIACRLSGCMITEVGCRSLASALTSNTGHLRELDLSYNHPGDSGVKLLSAKKEDSSCKLETLQYVLILIYNICKM